jgi:hypothetical protein
MEAKKHDHAQGEEVQSLQYGSNQCWWVIEFSQFSIRLSTWVLHLYLGQFNISFFFLNVENFSTFSKSQNIMKEYSICWNRNFKIN